MKKTIVGMSITHTPIKHFLTNGLAGMVIGAASKISSITEAIFIDACAGDFKDSLFSGTCSPNIFLKHLCWAINHGLNCRLFLIEKDVNSVTHLRANLQLMAQKIRESIIIIHADYRSTEAASIIGPCHSAKTAFLHIDPNHAHDVELSKELCKCLPERTTILVTLGCNAHGIKRLPLEERLKWYDRIQYLLDLKQTYHDACLIWLERDASQWAYLLTVPKKWKDRVIGLIEKLGDQLWQKGVGSSWLSDSKVSFWQSADRLFLKVDGSEARPQ